MAARKKATKKSAKNGAAKKNGNGAIPRSKFADDATIKVVGEHKRREGSRYFGGYEAMKKISTVAGFRKKFPEDATELLRAATKDGYAKIA